MFISASEAVKMAEEMLSTRAKERVAQIEEAIDDAIFVGKSNCILEDSEYIPAAVEKRLKKLGYSVTKNESTDRPMLIISFRNYDE